MHGFKRVVQFTGLIATIILVVITTSLILWYFIEGSEISKTAQQSHRATRIINPQGHIVYMLDQAFYPNTLVIQVGDLVQWENTGPDSITIVSDAVQARYMPTVISSNLDENERFSLSFSLPGEWHYHDGLHPSRMGRIIVE
jgi:plastocyanin